MFAQRRDRPARSCIWVVTVLSLASCGGELAEGEAQFSQGDYPRAKATFAALEPQARGWRDAKRAEYALYRGLTLGALGDRDRADVWLREAQGIEQRRPGSLSTTDARRMNVAVEAADRH
jgi:hypothetical protein